MSECLLKHKARLQEQVDSALKQLHALNQLEQQIIPEFQEVKKFAVNDIWREIIQSGDDWITEHELMFYEAEIDNGFFTYAIDFEEIEEEFPLTIGHVILPNATNEQLEILCNMIEGNRPESCEKVVLLHDYLDLKQYLKQIEMNFTCANTKTTLGYEQHLANILILGKEYRGYRIHVDYYYVLIDDDYYYFNKNQCKHFFKMKKKNPE